MENDNSTLNRREFVKKSTQVAAGAALVGAGSAGTAAPASKQVSHPSSMPLRTLGKTGIVVPLLGYGGGVLPRIYGGTGTMEERAAVVRYAYDKGVRFFDTADSYGESEEIMGMALNDIRDDVVLATKVSVLDHTETRKTIEQSLSRLQTDHLDLIQVHGTIGIEQMSFEEAMKVHGELVKLRDEGVVRFIGLTGHDYYDKVYRMIETGGFDTTLLGYGYIRYGEHKVYTHSMLEFREMCLSKAHELGMGIIAMKILRAGMLGEVSARIAPEIDAERRAQLPGAAVRFLLQDERVHVLNIGMSTQGVIDYNLDTLSGDTAYTDADRLLLAEYSLKAYDRFERQQAQA